jgi:hypothetical protein
MSMRAPSLCALLSTLLLAAVAEAGEIRGFAVPSQESALIGAREVMIYNSGQQDILCFLWSRLSPQQMLTIPPGEAQTFSDGTSGQYEIRVVTHDREVHYSLLGRKRYEIYWNPEHRVWDVAEMAPR